MYRGEGVAKLVAQHGQELVLRTVRRPERLLRLSQARFVQLGDGAGPSLRPDEREEQHANGRPRHEHEGYEGLFGKAVEADARHEGQGPAVPVEAHVLQAVMDGVVRRPLRGPVEQHPRGGRAVEDVVVDQAPWGGPEDPFEQVVHAERGEDEAPNVLTALGDPRVGTSLLVDRHVDQEAGLAVATGPGQSDGLGRGGPTGIARPLHRGEAAGPGGHVVALLPNVFVRTRLDERHRLVDASPALVGPDIEAGRVPGAGAGDERAQVLCGYALGVSHRLAARIAAGQGQALDEEVPLLSAHVRLHGEEACRSLQRLDVDLHPVLHLPPDVIGRACELGGLVTAQARGDVARGQGRSGEADGEHQARRPHAPRSLDPARRP